MDRLTARNKDGTAYFPQCFEEPCNGSGYQKDCCDFLAEACERLAQYEDAGLTPEQIRQIDELYADKCRELEGYKKLEEAGRIIKLPCAVGDTFYEIIHDDIPESVDYICEYTVEDISANAINFAGDWNPLDSIPNVYFTREEAEEALRKLKEGDGNGLSKQRGVSRSDRR